MTKNIGMPIPSRSFSLVKLVFFFPKYHPKQIIRPLSPGWTCLELLLAQFQDRLHFGVQRELCDLIQISLLNSSRARALFKAGVKTVSSLANAKPEDIELVLRNAVAFQSKQRQEGETDAERDERLAKGSRCIFVEGQSRALTLREASVAMILEARRLVEEQLGPPPVCPHPPRRAASRGSLLPSPTKRPTQRQSSTARLRPTPRRKAWQTTAQSRQKTSL